MSVQLFHGDCLEVMKQFPNNSINLVLTDPPYNLGSFMQNREVGLNRMRDNTFFDKKWDNKDNDEWEIMMDSFFMECTRLLSVGGGIIVFTSVLRVKQLKELAEKNGFYYKTTGIWHKTNPMPRNMNLQFINSTEPWLYFIHGKKTGIFNNDGKAFHDFVETSVTPLSERKFGKHPTAKPVKLMKHFVGLLSNVGDTVLDPFMGSGSTGVACCEMERNFIGIELDDTYFDISKKRIDELVGSPRQMEIVF